MMEGDLGAEAYLKETVYYCVDCIKLARNIGFDIFCEHCDEQPSGRTEARNSYACPVSTVGLCGATSVHSQV
jgi:hypothetical protein